MDFVPGDAHLIALGLAKLHKGGKGRLPITGAERNEIVGSFHAHFLSGFAMRASSSTVNCPTPRNGSGFFSGSGGFKPRITWHP